MLREGTCACFTSGSICRKTNDPKIPKSKVRGRERAAGERMSYSEDLHPAALAYHRLPRPGKLEIQATKPLANQRDLALAYSPGVAAPCTGNVHGPGGAGL